MKKLSFCIMTAFLLLSFMPARLKAETKQNASTEVITKTVESTDANASLVNKTAESADVNTVENARANAQLARLEEIKAMDMSTMTSSEKKELREEVKSIQNEQNYYGDRDGDHHDRDHHHHHGMFIGVGGGLLIIILLILLLG